MEEPEGSFRDYSDDGVSKIPMFAKNTDFPTTGDYKLSDLNNEPKKYLKSTTLKSPVKGK